MSGEGKEWYVAAPWGRIAIIAWGDSRSPPVLLCHGKLDSAASFAPLVRRLPPNFYYVALDLPGCGKSDWMPRGLPVTVHDLTYAIRVLVDHFQWDKLTFIGHSLGALLGLHYNAAYPNRVEKLVLLDPLPAYDTYEADEIPRWYFKFIARYFDEDGYRKYNAERETAPRYTRQKVVEILQSSRRLTAEVADSLADRVIEPAGDGLYRFTFDQRMKKVTRPPQSAEFLERVYTSITLPLQVILAQECVDRGSYDKVSFVRDPSKYPRGNYSVHTVEGTHDVHLTNPERVAPLVAGFLSPVASKL